MRPAVPLPFAPWRGLLALSSVVLLSAAPRAESSLWYLTGGPMLHWNFGADGFLASSGGLEFALWKEE